MNTAVYQCPCCGAPLAYSGENDKLQCAACGNAFEIEAIEQMAGDSESVIHFAQGGRQYSAEDAQQMSAYICKNCGAELVTESTTTATQCPYCGSPTILPDQLQDGVVPEKVVPFLISKEQAIAKFESYFQGKRLLPNVFKDSRNRISEIKKLYVPYWLFDCVADANMVYRAKRIHVQKHEDYEITKTEHYLVLRAGSLAFRNIPQDSSEKMNDKLSESLEPFDVSTAVPFQPAVLAGALADRADVAVEQCQDRAIQRVEQSVEETFRSTVSGYDSVSTQRKTIHSRDGRATPALMPVWIITTEKQIDGEKKIYTFAINGQTGELTCDVPYSKGKAWGWFLGVFAGAFAALFGLLVLLHNTGVIS